MQITSVRKNHIARSNEGTVFFFFFATLDEISCDLSLTYVLCRNIVYMQCNKDEIFYLLSFDVCLTIIQNAVSKIARNSWYINFLERRKKQEDGREKCIEISKR